MHSPGTNFYDIQNEFNKYWAQPAKKKILENAGKERLKNNNAEEVEGSELTAWTLFKRWEWMMEPRVYPTGNLEPPSDFFEAINKGPNSAGAAGLWTSLGPDSVPANVPLNAAMGRLCCIRFDPNNKNVVYAAGPGGLWKSINGGDGWVVWHTDLLGTLSISDLAIDPTNSNTMYIASGDVDLGYRDGNGVFKSVDGGITWNTTGLNWAITQGNSVNKILIDPVNPQILHVGTSVGMYRSVDSGVSFTKINSINVKDMEFKPGQPKTIYATADSTIFQSVNSGKSYSKIYSVPGAGRLSIAVTQADSNYLYVLASSSIDFSFLGFFQSTNGGVSFSLKTNTPNLLGYDNDGSDLGVGSGWYNLALAASPIMPNEVVMGGVNIWRSTDGGASWKINSHWMGDGAPYVHADCHDLIYIPGGGTTVFAAVDGGCFKTSDNGINWIDMSKGLEVGEMYRFGQSATSPSTLIVGLQDAGTTYLDGSGWSNMIAGDGGECFVDRTDDNILYGEYQFGAFQRSSDGGANWIAIQNGLSTTASFITPWLQDPIVPAKLWAGYQEVFKSLDNGDTWNEVSPTGGSEPYEIKSIDVAHSNNNVIYAARYSNIYKSIDEGVTWNNITAGLPTNKAYIMNLKIDPVDANHVWVTFSGYSGTNKVFVTKNGGNNWVNYSNGIPNFSVNCVEVDTSSVNQTIYVGTDRGVYYRDSTMTSWLPFSTGLPNIIVNELEIQYTAKKIRAATFGRGLWESSIAPITLGTPSLIKCEENGIEIFPNPSFGIFNVQLNINSASNVPSTAERKVKLNIYNTVGDVVYSACRMDNESFIRIDLSNLERGIYLLNIDSGTGSNQKKIVLL